MNKLLFIIFLLTLSSLAKAEDDDPGIVVTAPKRLLGHDYRLRLLGEEFPVEKKILFYDNPIAYRVELLAKDRRLLDTATARPHHSFYRELHPRQWRLTALAGNSQFDKKTHKRLFIDRSLKSHQFELTWRRYAINLHLIYSRTRFESACDERRLCVEYDGSDVGAGVGYEWASRWLQGLHGTVSFYGVFSQHDYELNDHPVRIASQASHPAARLALDFDYHLGRAFLLTISGSAQNAALRFRELLIDRQIHQSNLSGGISYDFH